MQAHVIIVSCILLIDLFCFAVPLEQSTSEEQSSYAEYAQGDADATDQSINNDVTTTIAQGSSATRTALHYILSSVTGQFVAITRSGRVQANANLGK